MTLNGLQVFLNLINIYEDIINSYNDESDQGYFLEVDFKYT